MKSIILSLAALVTFSAAAELKESMTVNLSDGTSVTYDVNKITNVTFESVEIPEALTVTPADGEKIIYQSIPSMLRVLPNGEGTTMEFGFGTVEAAAPADLIAGEYGVWLKIAPAKFGVADVNMAENPESRIITLIKYNEGQAESVLNELTEGTLTTAINQKTKQVTIKLSATFTDGTVVTVDYKGVPTNVESLEEMIPAKVYGNEVIITNADGSASGYFEVKYITENYSSGSGKTTIMGFNQYDEEAFRVEANESVLNKGTLNIPEIEGNASLTVRTANKAIQVTSPETSGYRNALNNGTAKVEKDENNEYHIFIEFDHSYTSMGNVNQGDKKHVIISFNGPVGKPEPEPEAE